MHGPAQIRRLVQSAVVRRPIRQNRTPVVVWTTGARALNSLSDRSASILAERPTVAVAHAAVLRGAAGAAAAVALADRTTAVAADSAGRPRRRMMDRDGRRAWPTQERRRGAHARRTAHQTDGNEVVLGERTRAGRREGG